MQLLHRFDIDLNACSSSFCGVASSTRVVAVLMVEMSLRKHPFNFNFNFGNREESHGAKSGEYGGRFKGVSLPRTFEKSIFLFVSIDGTIIREHCLKI